MTTWAKINPNQFLPSSIASAVTTIADALTSVLAAPASLSVPSLPSGPSAADAVRGVINALLDTVSGLLQAGRIHTLAIPIAKTIPQQPPPSLPPTLNDLQAALDITLGPSSTAAADAYAQLIQKNGGNAGFYNAFAASLMDVADENRPQYDAQTDAVAMAVLLVGSPSYGSITQAASTLDLLFKPKAGNTMAARTIPSPQNVSAAIVGASTNPGVGVRLDWQAPADTITARYFPGVSFTVSRYAVIRSTSPKAQSATTVLDLFPTQTLTEGMTSGPHKVIAIGSGKNSAFLDTDANLDAKTPYYYCVAWEVKVSENGSSSTLPFNKISNVTKVVPRAPAPQQTGTAPDWIATGSAIDAFPPLSTIAQQMIEETRVLLKPSPDAPSALTAAATLAAGATQRIGARSTELIDDVNRLATALANPIPSMYVTQMTSTTGGNAFLMSELARRLNDTSDPTRPPFDNGEYVCGVCFVAGAPRLADLAAIIAFFDSLFGPATAANPLMGVLAAIDTVVTAAETAVFGPNMGPLPPATVATVDPLTGLPPLAATPAIANDGTAVTTNDPKNPDAGFTNVTPTSELC